MGPHVRIMIDANQGSTTGRARTGAGRARHGIPGSRSRWCHGLRRLRRAAGQRRDRAGHGRARVRPGAARGWRGAAIDLWQPTSSGWAASRAGWSRPRWRGRTTCRCCRTTKNTTPRSAARFRRLRGGVLRLGGRPARPSVAHREGPRHPADAPAGASASGRRAWWSSRCDPGAEPPARPARHLLYAKIIGGIHPPVAAPYAPRRRSVPRFSPHDPVARPPAPSSLHPRRRLAALAGSILAAGLLAAVAARGVAAEPESAVRRSDSRRRWICR